MTREEISQVYYINREIEMWERKLEEFEEKSPLKSQELDGMPHSQTNQTGDPTGQAAGEALEIEETIKGLLQEIQYARKRIYQYIAELADSFMRQIIMYRCLSLCTWREVALNVGGGNTEDSVRKRFERHFDEEEKNE